VRLEILPEPDEDERRAILAALTAEDAERAGESAWARASLPAREDGADDQGCVTAREAGGLSPV
jgi:hypothetical protein